MTFKLSFFSLTASHCPFLNCKCKVGLLSSELLYHGTVQCQSLWIWFTLLHKVCGLYCFVLCSFVESTDAWNNCLWKLWWAKTTVSPSACIRPASSKPLCKVSSCTNAIQSLYLCWCFFCLQDLMLNKKKQHMNKFKNKYIMHNI